MMHALISKIGKGQKGAKDLTWVEAKEGMTALIEGQATPAQVGAFLMAMRIKMESITELAAFTAVARQYVAPVTVPPGRKFVDLPLYGEKHGTYHVVIAASIVAASAGASILLHGVENPAAACQMSEVLKQVGIPIPEDLPQLSNRLSTSPLVYLDLALYHPPLVRLLDLRQELGGQNLAHQVARMLNPARTHSQVIGLAHPPYLEKITEALRLIETPRALVLQGVEGFPELSISAPTPARELRGGHVTPLTFRPPDTGMRFGSYQTMSSAAFSGERPRPEEEATLMMKILRNQIRGDHRAWVLLNAALLIYAAGKASSLMEAAPLAHQALDSGSAFDTLQTLAANPPKEQSNLSPSTTAVPA
jgi:anthranilate phosphoribosyltransferase